MPHPKDDPKNPEWRPYIFARDQWHCRICGDRFLYSEMVRKHIADEHDENMPPSMYEYFRGAVWQRKKIRDQLVTIRKRTCGPEPLRGESSSAFLSLAASSLTWITAATMQSRSSASCGTRSLRRPGIHLPIVNRLMRTVIGRPRGARDHLGHLGDTMGARSPSLARSTAVGSQRGARKMASTRLTQLDLRHLNARMH